MCDQTERFFSSVRVQDESEVATQKTKQLKKTKYGKYYIQKMQRVTTHPKTEEVQSQLNLPVNRSSMVLT